MNEFHTPIELPRQKRKPTKNESIALLEEALFDAEQKGNKRKADALRKVIRRIRTLPRQSELDN